MKKRKSLRRWMMSVVVMLNAAFNMAAKADVTAAPLPMSEWHLATWEAMAATLTSRCHEDQLQAILGSRRQLPLEEYMPGSLGKARA